jgi:type II secretory pathway pseudopilin PulG
MLLLEVMLALAIFVMAGTAILALVGRSVAGMERARLAQRAADLARSAMAKIEAGLETPQTLNGPVRAWEPEGEIRGGGVVDSLPADSGWELKIDTEPSQFAGLTRVTVRALKQSAGAERASYTLRQLVRLGGKGEDRAGGTDALAEEAKRGADEPSRDRGRRPADRGRNGSPPPGGRP